MRNVLVGLIAIVVGACADAAAPGGGLRPFDLTGSWVGEWEVVVFDTVWTCGWGCSPVFLGRVRCPAAVQIDMVDTTFLGNSRLEAAKCTYTAADSAAFIQDWGLLATAVAEALIPCTFLESGRWAMVGSAGDPQMFGSPAGSTGQLSAVAHPSRFIDSWLAGAPMSGPAPLPYRCAEKRVDIEVRLTAVRY